MDGAEVETLIRRAAAALVAEGAREVYVFGSFARGQPRLDSDLDLAVAGLPADRLFRAMERASEQAGRDVDIIRIEREGPLIRFLARKGELRRVA
jgi:predicted nucleotidyltransferase